MTLCFEGALKQLSHSECSRSPGNNKLALTGSQKKRPFPISGLHPKVFIPNPHPKSAVGSTKLRGIDSPRFQLHSEHLWAMLAEQVPTITLVLINSHLLQEEGLLEKRTAHAFWWVMGRV